MSSPSPTREQWTCGAAGVAGLHTYPSSAHEGKEPTQLYSSPPYSPTGLFPAPCLFIPCSLSSSCHSANKESHGIFPKPETEPTWAHGTDQKWHPKGCPHLSLERRPQGEGPEGGCGVRKLPSPGLLGQGVQVKRPPASPPLSSAFLSIHPAPPPRVPIKGAASSQTTSVPQSLGPKPLPTLSRGPSSPLLPSGDPGLPSLSQGVHILELPPSQSLSHVRASFCLLAPQPPQGARPHST